MFIGRLLEMLLVLVSITRSLAIGPGTKPFISPGPNSS